MMGRRLTIACMVLGLALFFSPTSSWAVVNHLAQAIDETKEAIHEGKQGLATSLVEHAVNARDHARIAERQRPNSHIKKGITHLSRAIKAAKRTHAQRRINRGIKHAEQALAEFESANR